MRGSGEAEPPQPAFADPNIGSQPIVYFEPFEFKRLSGRRSRTAPSRACFEIPL